MKIDARISLLFQEDGLRIELVDGKSGVMFFRGRMNTEETCQAMSRMARVSVNDAQVFRLDVVGKKLETTTLTAKMPKISGWDKEVARVAADGVCPDGWEVNDSFSSQGSFFSMEGENFVRFKIRRWVDAEDEG